MSVNRGHGVQVRLDAPKGLGPLHIEELPGGRDGCRDTEDQYSDVHDRSLGQGACGLNVEGLLVHNCMSRFGRCKQAATKDYDICRD